MLRQRSLIEIESSATSHQRRSLPKILEKHAPAARGSSTTPARPNRPRAAVASSAPRILAGFPRGSADADAGIAEAQKWSRPRVRTAEKVRVCPPGRRGVGVGGGGRSEWWSWSVTVSEGSNQQSPSEIRHAGPFRWMVRIFQPNSRWAVVRLRPIKRYGLVWSMLLLFFFLNFARFCC